MVSARGLALRICRDVAQIFGVEKEEILKFIVGRLSTRSRVSHGVDKYYFPLLCSLFLKSLPADILSYTADVEEIKSESDKLHSLRKSFLHHSAITPV